MDLPHVSHKSLAPHSFAPGDSLVTIAYEFTSGSAAELIPTGTSDVFPISGPSGAIEMPLSQHKSVTLRTPNEETKVLINVLSSR